MTDPSQYFKGRTVQEQMNEVIGYVDVRSAEVATNAIAADVAQVHQDMLDADADAAAAAASAAAAAGTLANAVKKTGEASQSIAGDIAVAGTLSGGVVTGTQVTVPAPVNNTDAATKKYVDDADALKLNITDVNSVAVGLTGNQTKTGELILTTWLQIEGGHDRSLVRLNNNRFNTLQSGQSEGILSVFNTNGTYIGGLVLRQEANGVHRLQLNLLNADGITMTTINLGSSS